MMGSDLAQVAMNEYQELLIDTQWQLVESKGKLFTYKAIGGIPARGRPVQNVLGDFWTREVKRLCIAALEKGLSGAQVLENHRNGSNLSLLFRVVPSIQSGQVCGLVLRIYDITVSKRLEQQQELREKMKTVTQLASQVVHKMNSPIAAILNRIGSLLVKDSTEYDHQKVMAELLEIQEQLYAVSMLTTALTAFSNESPKDYRLVQVNSVIEDAVHLLHVLNSNSNITFDIKLAEDLPRILGSEVTLEQCFVNICINAIEAMPDGGALAIITNVDEQFHDFINITFSDNGAGIPEETLKYVMEPFFTTKDETHNGLGLSVCYGIVSNHNGSVEISSQRGIGTTVQVILPIAKL